MIKEEILTKRQTFIEKGKSPQKVLIPAGRSKEILELAELANNIPFKPSPPIKRKVQNSNSGLFTTHTINEIEYDHHAPEYLKQLEEYEKEMKRHLTIGTKLYIYGMEVIFEPRVQQIEVI